MISYWTCRDHCCSQAGRRRGSLRHRSRLARFLGSRIADCEFPYSPRSALRMSLFDAMVEGSNAVVEKGRSLEVAEPPCQEPGVPVPARLGGNPPSAPELSQLSQFSCIHHHGGYSNDFLHGPLGTVLHTILMQAARRVTWPTRAR